ncbi:MAG TPA: CsgG/HfaB family protein [Candidatus Binatia bacterium]|nr:CsgG/HfaB family protein [Candidatus Binatia bacterium]
MIGALRSLLVVVSLSGWLAACSTTSTATTSSTVAPAPPPSLRRQTVAVFPFANDGVAGHERLDFLREWLADSLGAALQSSGELRVVERREILKILQEQKLGSSALASKEGRLELGKIAGAQTLIFGDFAAVGDVLQISARIVDVESGVILKSSSVHGDVDSARALGEDLSRRLAQDLGITIARAAQASGITSDRALAEAELFYQGMRLEKQGESARAIERYREALEIDPNDREAKERLRKLLSASH